MMRAALVVSYAPLVLGCAPLVENCFGPASGDWPLAAPKTEITKCCSKKKTCDDTSGNSTDTCSYSLVFKGTCWYGKCCSNTGTCDVPIPSPPAPTPPFPPAMPGSEHHWAVLVAGSNTFSNYRHQADVCHAYQVMKAKGVPEDHIILMSYDDVANSKSNPFPGKLYNQPDPKGPGIDVYAGCNIDYRGTDVTPANFKAVLLGTAAGKKLESTSEDQVFVAFFDHGAPGLIAFPKGTLHTADMQATFQSMADKKMFKKLVFYLESCESGSMFEGMDIPNVYALSAANPTESSWGTYCGNDAKVNGKLIGSCLGDLFSVNWMEDTDAQDTTKESLSTQFTTVHTLTDKSSVMQWSDVNFTEDFVSEYVGGLTKNSTKLASTQKKTSSVSAREIDLSTKLFNYVHASTSSERHAAGLELQKQLEQQVAVETAYGNFLAIMYSGDEAKMQHARSSKHKPKNMECEMAAHTAFEEHGSAKFDANAGFSLQFHQLVVNVCAEESESNVNIVDAVARACYGLDTLLM